MVISIKNGSEALILYYFPTNVFVLSISGYVSRAGFQFFGRTWVLFQEPLSPLFSTSGDVCSCFEAMVDILARLPARNWFLRFTSGETPADCLATSMICRLVLRISLIFPIISRQRATYLFDSTSYFMRFQIRNHYALSLVIRKPSESTVMLYRQLC